ncbi:MAG: hypothetical protein IKO72_07150 [Kiritimatiellae bacterium]|nr:hypothetical protein [Kiritimatiellia bacterium]
MGDKATQPKDYTKEDINLFLQLLCAGIFCFGGLALLAIILGILGVEPCHTMLP